MLVTNKSSSRKVRLHLKRDFSFFPFVNLKLVSLQTAPGTTSLGVFGNHFMFFMYFFTISLSLSLSLSFSFSFSLSLQSTSYKAKDGKKVFSHTTLWVKNPYYEILRPQRLAFYVQAALRLVHMSLYHKDRIMISMAYCDVIFAVEDRLPIKKQS